MVAEQNIGAPASSRSRVISKILPPAIRLWFRSQLESVEDLQFQIAGDDREILSGQIPSVTIAAQRLVYQGIAISQISAIGQDIRINLGEILRGKPLRLMNGVPVQTEARLTESDLNASLQTPLLANALTELLLHWLQLARLDGLPEPIEQVLRDQQTLQAQPVHLHQLQVSLRANQLVLGGTLVSDQHSLIPFAITTGWQVIDGAKLRLDRPHLLEHLQAHQGKPLDHLQGYEINLGSEVTIQQLTLEDKQITCCGVLNILP